MSGTATQEEGHRGGLLVEILVAAVTIALPLAVAPGFLAAFSAPKALVAALLVPLALGALGARAFARRSPLPERPAVRVLLLGGLAVLLLSGLGHDGLATHPPGPFAAAAPLFPAALAALFGLIVGSRGPRTERLGPYLGVGAVAVLLVGLARRELGWFAFIPDRPDTPFAATLGNGNDLAAYAAPLAVLLLFLPARRVLWLRLLSLAPLALAGLSASRAGWLAVVTGLCVGALALALRGPRLEEGLRGRRYGRGLLALLAPALLVVLFLPGLGEFRGRVANAFDPEAPTTKVRTELWQAAWATGLESPWTGVGVGDLEVEINPHRGRFEVAEEWRRLGRFTFVEAPHQEFLWIFAAMGMLGVVWIAGLGATVFRSVRRLGGTAASPEVIELRIAAGATLASFVWPLLAWNPLHHPTTILVPALALGLLHRGPAEGVAPRATARARIEGPLLGGLVLILAACAVADVREDAHAADLVATLRAGEEATRAGDAERGLDLFARASEELEAVAAAPFADAHRLWRVALVAGELDRLRSRLVLEGREREDAASLAAAGRLLPAEVVDTLQSWTLARNPAHVPAALALVTRSLSRPADPDAIRTARTAARERLERTLEAHPMAPRVRALLAALALDAGAPDAARALLEDEAELFTPPWPEDLRRDLGQATLLSGRIPTERTFDWTPPGSDPLAMTGAWFDAWRTGEAPPPLPTKILAPARAALERGRLEVARDAAYRVLAEHPTDLETLHLLADVLQRLAAREPSPIAREAAEAATAKTRLWLALQTLGTAPEDDANAARRARGHLERAARAVPELADLVLARALLARRIGDTAALAALREELIALGRDPTTLE